MEHFFTLIYSNTVMTNLICLEITTNFNRK